MATYVSVAVFKISILFIHSTIQVPYHKYSNNVAYSFKWIRYLDMIKTQPLFNKLSLSTSYIVNVVFSIVYIEISPLLHQFLFSSGKKSVSVLKKEKERKTNLANWEAH